MPTRTAILAGYGHLPQMIAKALGDAIFVTFDGVDVDVPAGDHLPASFEKLGGLFKGLRAQGVSDVVFAGAMSRPALNPLKFDTKTMAIMPRLMKAMGQGDDALLRAIIAVFEAEGFNVRAAQEIAPSLVLGAGVVKGRAASQGELDDAGRAYDILTALSPQDVSQGAVVEQGQCLGIETLQGTDALLQFVSETPARLRRGKKGVFVKTAKVGQDMRVDVPTIGPNTVRGVVQAGLAGMFITAGGAIVLEQEKVFSLIEKHGLFLIAR